VPLAAGGRACYDTRMRAILMGILGLVVGSVGSVFVLFFGYILFILVTGYEDFEGATAMGMAAFVAPLVALIGGIAGAALFVGLSRPRKQA
jgi:hypothetical protein